MIRSITNFFVQHPEIPLDDDIQKKRKIDFQIENVCVKVFFSQNEYSTINTHDHDPITERSFHDLMSVQKEKNLPYLLAMSEENNGNIQYVDASSMLQLQKENLKNFAGKIHYFVINFQETEENCFHYLGNSYESDQKNIFINTYIQATENDPISQYNLALYYGQGNIINEDPIEAVKWFKRGALQGDSDAEFSLGLCYLQSIGLEKDFKEAVRLFGSSASKGHVEAQVNLGICYFLGCGVNKNFGKAARYFRFSADVGNAEGQCNLGICYNLGLGVVQDCEKAKYWFLLSANQGNLTAQAHLKHYDNQSDNPGSETKKVKYFNGR